MSCVPVRCVPVLFVPVACVPVLSRLTVGPSRRVDPPLAPSPPPLPSPPAGMQDEANEAARQAKLKLEREAKAIELRERVHLQQEAAEAAEKELAYRIKKDMSISTKQQKEVSRGRAALGCLSRGPPEPQAALTTRLSCRSTEPTLRLHPPRTHSPMTPPLTPPRARCCACATATP